LRGSHDRNHRDTSARGQFAQHLRALLKESGLSQAALARRLRQAGFERVGEPRVSEWCNGRALPRDEWIVFTIESLTGRPNGELVAQYWTARGQPLPEPTVPLPRELPVRLGEFTGRRAELERLRLLLADEGNAAAARIVAIHGLGGIGKSALAVEAAWRLAGRYPDGQLYLDLHGASHGLAPVNSGNALGRLLRSLGQVGASIPVDPDEATARYRSLLAGRRMLVVLDNAASSAQVRPLLPASPGCGALITSREVLADLDNTHQLRLDMLSPADAVLLLDRIVRPKRVADDPSAARAIAQLCAYLPLALRIAGARLAARPGWSPALLAARLRDERHRLDELQVGDLAVRASFQVSYAALAAADDRAGRRAASLFRLLGLLAAPEVSVAMAAALAGEPLPLAEVALERLVDAQILETWVPGRYRMHDLLRLFARELAMGGESEAARAEALERVVGWQLATTRRAVRLAYPADQWRAAGDTAGAAALAGQADGFAWLEAERVNLVAVSEQAAAGSGRLPAAVGPLAGALFRYLQMGGHWPELQALNQRALRVAEAAGDRPGPARPGPGAQRPGHRLLVARPLRPGSGMQPAQPTAPARPRGPPRREPGAGQPQPGLLRARSASRRARLPTAEPGDHPRARGPSGGGTGPERSWRRLRGARPLRRGAGLVRAGARAVHSGGRSCRPGDRPRQPDRGRLPGWPTRRVHRPRPGRPGLRRSKHRRAGAAHSLSTSRSQCPWRTRSARCWASNACYRRDWLKTSAGGTASRRQ